MMKVPLIPYQRPVPKILLRSVPQKEPETTANKKRNPAAMVTKAAKHKFTATNIEDITKKPEPVQKLWHLLAKLDPNGDLWTDNKGIVAVDGSTAKDSPDRTPKALKLNAEDTETVTSFAIYDGPEPDDAKLATGLIFTVYQLVEVAFAAGIQYEAARLTSAMTAAANGPVDEDEDDEFDDEDGADEDMEEVSDEEDVIDEDDDDDDDE